jgi:hypothetical protein
LTAQFRQKIVASRDVSKRWSKKAAAASLRAFQGTKSLDEANLPNLFC